MTKSLTGETQMTRHDYRIIANGLADARGQANQGDHCDTILDRLEEAWITLFAKDNPHFSPTKFKEASQP